MILAVSGIRDLDPRDVAVVEMETLEAVATLRPESMLFGGARGSDTVALRAACDLPLRKVVVVPGRLVQQPQEARAVAQRCADEVEELGLDLRNKGSFLERNDWMLDRATRLLAFTDGSYRGGTRYTILEAEKRRIPVDAVAVRRTSGSDLGAPFDESPLGCFLDTPFDFGVFALERYVSRYSRQSDLLSDLVRAMKVNEAPVRAVAKLGERLAFVVAERYGVSVLVPVPRRTPGAENDLGPLARRVSVSGEDIADGTDALVRVRPPRGGVVRMRRERFTPEEHARTMAYRGRPGAGVVLLDNVVTTGGSLAGAALAVRRGGGRVLGAVALLAAGDWQCVSGA